MAIRFCHAFKILNECLNICKYNWNYDHSNFGIVDTVFNHPDTEIMMLLSLQWCHNECNGVSNLRRLDSLLSRLLRHRSKKTSNLCVTGLCKKPVDSPHKGPVTRKLFPCHHDSWIIRSMLWLLIHWLHASPGHQQPRYWLYKIRINLPPRIEIFQFSAWLQARGAIENKDKFHHGKVQID